MHELGKFGLKIIDFKSFGSDGGGFEKIKPLNVIIGRNNSGKSALIDAVGHAVSQEGIALHFGHDRREARLELTGPSSLDQLKRVFSESHRDEIIGNHWRDFGRLLVDSRIVLQLGNNRTKSFVRVEPQREIPHPFASELAISHENPFARATFYRLEADRDVRPEKETGSLEISGSGEGLSRTLARIYNNETLDRTLVEKRLLRAINSIFEPDATFTRIFLRQKTNEAWELYLDEEGKGPVSLSASGSGLKTVLLLTTFVEILPVIQKRDLNQCIFAFEELENNLHPAVQRRLMAYVRRVAIESEATVFLTTHSSSVIDFFAKDEAAQIIHVTHDKQKSTAKRVRTYFEHSGILDDLDVRASDLLQANGVIWVEGPSDRLYLNRWIDLWSAGQIQEGIHYQTIFYGGRLLSHLSGEDPSISGDDAIRILRVNRRAIILIDSDKDSAEADINDTKKRIQAEIEGSGGYAWITAGRTIENYLPIGAVKAILPEAKRPISQFDDPAKYFERYGLSARKFARSKVLCAEKFVREIALSDAKQVLDLNEQMARVTAKILDWNKF